MPRTKICAVCGDFNCLDDDADRLACCVCRWATEEEQMCSWCRQTVDVSRRIREAQEALDATEGPPKGDKRDER